MCGALFADASLKHSVRYGGTVPLSFVTASKPLSSFTQTEKWRAGSEALTTECVYDAGRYRHVDWIL